MTFSAARAQSHGSLINTAASDVTAATNLTEVTNQTKHSQYLETSLDGESVRDNNYDYCDYDRYREETGSINTLSSSVTNKSRPPLETSM